MKCPICETNLVSKGRYAEVERPIDEFECFCNNDFGMKTFDCEMVQDNIISMCLRLLVEKKHGKHDVLTFVYTNLKECKWILYLWVTNGYSKGYHLHLGTGSKPLNPPDALTLVNRYKKLLIFS